MKLYSNVQGMGSAFANHSANMRRMQPFAMCHVHKHMGCMECPKPRAQQKRRFTSAVKK